MIQGEQREYFPLNSNSFGLLNERYGKPLEETLLIGHNRGITYVLDSGAIFQAVLNNSSMNLPKISGKSLAVESGEIELKELGLELKLKRALLQNGNQE